jgi:dolichyl-phosphate-mannose--protein O-mannosyl transferase
MPFLIYFSIFAIHLGLLNKTGPGDAFMSLGFQKTLEGNNINAEGYKPLGLIAKFVELNLKMYGANATLKATHPYSSKWYEWPVMIKPIYYWYQAPKAVMSPEENTINYKASRIYLLGNPVIWWASTIALILLVYKLLAGGQNKKIKILILGGFLLNLLPFISIGRVMFLYHYMVALIFAILALAHLIDETKYRNKIFAVLIISGVAAFLFFAPLTYGLPLTEHAYNLRIWFPAWK